MISLSNRIDDVMADKEMSRKISDDRIERFESNTKVLEAQYESTLADKFNTTKKLSLVETQCAELQRELQLLMERNRKQEIKINSLRLELRGFNEEKKRIGATFDLLKKQEMIFGELKSKFEAQIAALLNGNSGQKDLSTSSTKSEPSCGERNKSPDANELPSSPTSDGTELIKADEIKPHLKVNDECVASSVNHDHSYIQSVLQEGCQVS